jgi:hypothetical protein
MAEQAAFAAIERVGGAMASADPAAIHWLTMLAFAAQCEQVSSASDAPEYVARHVYGHVHCQHRLILFSSIFYESFDNVVKWESEGGEWGVRAREDTR